MLSMIYILLLYMYTTRVGIYVKFGDKLLQLLYEIYFTHIAQ
jgi:hypothetical protein